ncbi:lipopolysaccharide biosynthesis protein [Desulfoluna spongiiphila]|uniref:Membrane protein involved in the export of O-antigen and teichoic acid n=1 Tax=Desulfoluna spongiiphila TaxID=419481 RepID=A0A1G5ETI1_9BACT|nr:oligosaccharide flippase family protein [Desulfoluna spongiiphila]SCY30306.1 Membrane protein involved in the export of O-antigen and teichoic acid [Desulfoluna spongiiphila]VVS91326.1 polysaccharide biosynthesis protein [Desulfoluna spongiiphila]
MNPQSPNNDKENIAKTVSRNSLFTIVYNVWYLGSRLVLTPLILSYITIEEYGLWAYCFVVLSYLALTAFGFNNTYIRYAADYRSRGENDKVNQLLSTGIISMVGIGLLLFLLFLPALPVLIPVLGIDPELNRTAHRLFVGTAAIFVLNFSLAGYQCVLEGEQQIALVRKIHLFASVVELVLLLLFFRMGMGVFSLLWAYAIRFGLIILLTIFFAHRVFPFLSLRFRHLRVEALKKFGNFGGKMSVLGLLSLLINSVDRIFITRILHLESAGLYEIGRKLPNIGMMLPSAVAGTLMPAASHLEGSGLHRKLRGMYLRSTRYIMLLSGLPYAFLIFFAPQIIEVWVGPGYDAPARVMQILALGTLINLFTGSGTACVRGMGLPGYEIRYMVISAAMLLTLTPVFIYAAGLEGAAWAYTLAQATGSLYFLHRANGLFAVPWKTFIGQTVPPVLLIFAAGLPGLFLCRSLWADVATSRWPGLFFLALFGCAHLILALLLLLMARNRLFTPEEKHRLSEITPPKPMIPLWSKLWNPQ